MHRIPPFSYFRGRILWEAAGRIAAHCWVSALPIASFTPASLRHSGGNRQRLAANVLLGVLVAARAAVLLRRLLRKLRAQQGGAGGASSAASSRAASFLRSLSWRHKQPAPPPPPQQQQRRAAQPSLLVVAVGDRLLFLDLITTALMLLALVLMTTSLAVSVFGGVLAAGQGVCLGTTQPAVQVHHWWKHGLGLQCVTSSLFCFALCCTGGAPV